MKRQGFAGLTVLNLLLGSPTASANPLYLNPALAPAPPESATEATSDRALDLQWTGERSNTESSLRVKAVFRMSRVGTPPWWLATGYEWYDTWGSSSVSAKILPIQLGTDFTLGSVSGTLSGGADIIGARNTSLFFDVRAKIPVDSAVSPTAVLDCRTHRATATSVDQGVYACRTGVDFFWPLDAQWSIFGAYRYGSYSDGNNENQIIGSLTFQESGFSLGANLFNWSYSQDRESSYFSPPDFLVLTGSVGLTTQVTDDLSCTLLVNLGQQRLKSQWAAANGYEGRCRWQWQEQLSWQSSLKFSNVQNRDVDNYNNAEWQMSWQWLF